MLFWTALFQFDVLFFFRAVKSFFNHLASRSVRPSRAAKLPMRAFPIRLSGEHSRFALGVPLYFSPLGDMAVIACLRVITRGDSLRSPTPQTPASRQPPQPQCSVTGGEIGGTKEREREEEGRGGKKEEKRKETRLGSN